MNKSLKTLSVYAYDLNKSGVTRKVIDNIAKIQVISPSDASFQLDQALDVVDKVCSILSQVSSTAAFLYANDAGFLANNDTSSEFLNALLDWAAGSTDAGILAKAAELSAYVKDTTMWSSGVLETKSVPLFDAKAVLSAKIEASGIKQLLTGVPAVFPDTDAPVDRLQTAIISGSQLGYWGAVDDDELQTVSNVDLNNAGALRAQVARQNTAHMDANNQVTVYCQVSSANSAAASVPTFQNRSGRSVEVKMQAKVYGLLNTHDDAAALDTTVDHRTDADITSADFITVDGVEQKGYRAIDAGDNSDVYVFAFDLAPDSKIAVSMPATNGVTTDLCIIRLEVDGKLTVTSDEVEFIDLAGRQNAESRTILKSMFQRMDTGILQEFDQYLQEKYTVSKLANLATLCGVTHWRLLFDSDFWASIPTGSSVQAKRILAKKFQRTIAIMARMILSNCDFLTWYST